ncbi:MAG: hypothetical protein QG622_537, partial [Actinomycetota bacterium]|nr:hypothetical protein [Actinomycetota bacterium]
MARDKRQTDGSSTGRPAASGSTTTSEEPSAPGTVHTLPDGPAGGDGLTARQHRVLD